jgi:hypothetical protein
MHRPIKVKSPNNTSKWQMGFKSAFKGLTEKGGQHYTPAALHPRKSSGARFTGGWLGPEALLSICVKRKSFASKNNRLK